MFQERLHAHRAVHSTRGVSSARAICKLLLREYAYARGGGGVIAVFDPAARTRAHARAHACTPNVTLVALATCNRLCEICKLLLRVYA